MNGPGTPLFWRQNGNVDQSSACIASRSTPRRSVSVIRFDVAISSLAVEPIFLPRPFPRFAAFWVSLFCRQLVFTLPVCRLVSTSDRRRRRVPYIDYAIRLRRRAKCGTPSPSLPVAASRCPSTSIRDSRTLSRWVYRYVYSQFRLCDCVCVTCPWVDTWL